MKNSKNKGINIIHFHPEMKNNKGDRAITQSIEDLLKENIKTEKYTHFLITQIKEMNYPRYLYRTLKGNIGSKIIPTFKPFSYIYKKIRYIQIKKIVEKINKYDLFIIGGGGIYSNFFFPLDRRILSKVKIPIVIFSPGLNINLNSPELTKEAKESIRYLNSIAKLSSVRDENTLKVLKKELKKNTFNIGCPSILLNEKQSKKFNVSTNNFNIGLNIGFHVNSITKEKVDEIINLYSYIVNKLNLRKPIKIYYFKHHPKEKYVIKNLKNKFKNMVVIDLPPKEMKYYYGKMDFVLCMMLHSSILSFGSRTNFFNFAYNSKNIAFMKDIGKIKDYIRIDKLKDEYSIYKKILDSIKRADIGNQKLFENNIIKFIKKIKMSIKK